MAANYDNSAWYYDRLSRLVYRRALINARIYLLHYVPANATILIAGGGTGWILEELVKVHPSGLTIAYAEVSSRMIKLAQKRNCGANNVKFINQPVEEIDFPDKFDLVITPFLFDNFSEENFDKLFNYLDKNLKGNGLLLNASFQLTGKWWQIFLLKTMFIFFRLTCGIEARGLPGIKKRFNESGYRLIGQQKFFGDFVISTILEKP